MSNPNPAPGRRFQPGQSGNPGGRWAKSKDLVLHFAKKRVPDDPKMRTWAEALVEAAFRRGALGRNGMGDPKIQAYLLDRLFGKVTTPIEVTGLEQLAERIAKARNRLSESDADSPLIRRPEVGEAEDKQRVM